MSVRKTIPYSSGVFFITFTCVEWIPLFELTNSYDLIYKWFDILKRSGHAVHGYVIMPNHLHVIISFKNQDKSINTIVGNGKRFIAYDIVRRLVAAQAESVLNRLSNLINSTERNRNKKHAIFEPSFDWKDCSSIDIAEQKLNYIHLNPCRSNPPLVDNPIDYIHSSASQYLGGSKIVYPVSNIMSILDFRYR